MLRRRPGDGHDHPARLSAAPHSHGLVDESIKRSREGVRTVSASLAVLLATAIAQAVVFVATDSVALLRLVNPQAIDHLGAVALAGAAGFAGNEIAARVRLRAGARLESPALIADGNHARVDGLVSLAVVASAAVVAIGFDAGDPLIGLAITLVILRITWQSWQTIAGHGYHHH